MSTDTLSQDQITAITDRVRALMPQVRADLEELVRIPSVSLETFDQARVDESAEHVKRLFEAEGVTCEIVREGGRPAVIGHKSAAVENAPTIMLYAHHDVQPPGNDEDWDSAPFEPTERDGRLYGRGTADDKAGVLLHLAALRAFGDELPVNVNVFIEGEEEIGSESMVPTLERHRAKLGSDAIIIADSGNWAIGEPALTTTLRGLIRADLEVRTLDHGIHSGMSGGAVPDAVTALIRLLASFHDDAGDVTIEGLDTTDVDELDYDEDRLRAESGLLDGVSPIGTGSILSRIWGKPSLTTIGIDATPISRSSNTLSPSARARISLRLAPTQDPERAYAALQAHVEKHTPWGAKVTTTLVDSGAGFDAESQGPLITACRAALADAYGVQPVNMGVGGSIPFIGEYNERFPDAEILCVGVEDPDTRAHGANESLHLGDFERACVAQALFFARAGARDA